MYKVYSSKNEYYRSLHINLIIQTHTLPTQSNINQMHKVLFLVYINNITKQLNYENNLAFADDTLLPFHDETWDEATAEASHSPNKVNKRTKLSPT